MLFIVEHGPVTGLLVVYHELELSRRCFGVLSICRAGIQGPGTSSEVPTGETTFRNACSMLTAVIRMTETRIMIERREGNGNQDTNLSAIRIQQGFRAHLLNLVLRHPLARPTVYPGTCRRAPLALPTREKGGVRRRKPKRRKGKRRVELFGTCREGRSYEKRTRSSKIRVWTWRGLE